MKTFIFTNRDKCIFFEKRKEDANDRKQRAKRRKRALNGAGNIKFLFINSITGKRKEIKRD